MERRPKSITLRLLIDTLIALMLASILCVIVWRHLDEQHRLIRFQKVHTALATLHETAIFHSALADVELTSAGFPTSISLAWFSGDDVPQNALLGGDRTWLDLAPPDNTSANPPDPVAYTLDTAAFWYNPNRGIFRARVPPQMTTARTLQLYNRINNASLFELPDAPSELERGEKREESRERGEERSRQATNAAVEADSDVPEIASPADARIDPATSQRTRRERPNLLARPKER